MIQELFHIGPIVISPFGVMLVLAFFSGYLQLRRGMKRLGVGDEEDASSILFAAGVGGVLGAKIYYAILYGDWHLLFDRFGPRLVRRLPAGDGGRRLGDPAAPVAVLAAPGRRHSGAGARLRCGADRLLPGRRRLWPTERTAVGDRLSERPPADDGRLLAVGIQSRDSPRHSQTTNCCASIPPSSTRRP